MKHFSWKNHTQNVVEKLFPDPFLKYQNWAYLRINILKFYLFCLYCLESRALSKLIETKLQTTCIYLIKKNKKKTKRGLEIKRSLEQVCLPHFLHGFWRKIFLLLYFFTWPYFNVWLPLLREILENMCIVILC